MQTIPKRTLKVPQCSLDNLTEVFQSTEMLPVTSTKSTKSVQLPGRDSYLVIAERHPIDRSGQIIGFNADSSQRS
ncbi:hypothetical protein TNCV_107841 [Trichonephila clavipes]|nr:hypothetical protein TNCV_107841 [Trichonephila clavipes]